MVKPNIIEKCLIDLVLNMVEDVIDTDYYKTFPASLASSGGQARSICGQLQWC